MKGTPFTIALAVLSLASIGLAAAHVSLEVPDAAIGSAYKGGTPRPARLRRQGKGLAPIKLEAEAQGKGTWTTEVPPLSIKGKWKVKVDVRVSDFDLVSLPGTVVVK